MATKHFMLVSKEKNKYAEIDLHRVVNGAFHTDIHNWLFPQIIDFIKQSNAKIILDPFAGKGDILKACATIGYENTIGFDINSELDWKINDSLKKIPKIDNAIIITNPQYLAKHSAKRKRVFDKVKEHYAYGRDDLYQVALDRCLEAYDYVIAIIPETFLNSSYPKDRLYIYTIVEEKIFTGTDCPVCIASFGPKPNKYSGNFEIYKNSKHIGDFQKLRRYILNPNNSIKIYFNDKDGQIALKAVDGQRATDQIRFLNSNDFYYKKDNIKVSSRLMTYIRVDNIKNLDVMKIINECNNILNEYRSKTHNIFLSPFKGNNSKGKRRRRLDYLTARAIIEKSIEKDKGNTKAKQLVLWS
jgi:hypothetical protein